MHAHVNCSFLQSGCTNTVWKRKSYPRALQRDKKVDPQHAADRPLLSHKDTQWLHICMHDYYPIPQLLLHCIILEVFLPEVETLL